MSSEPDSLLSVEVGSLPEHALDAAGAADALVDGDLTEDLVAVLFFESEEVGLLLGDLRSEDFLDGGDAADVAGELLGRGVGEGGGGGGN